MASARQRGLEHVATSSARAELARFAGPDGQALDEREPEHFGEPRVLLGRARRA